MKILYRRGLLFIDTMYHLGHTNIVEVVMDMSFVSNRTDEQVLEAIKQIQNTRQPNLVSMSDIAEHVGCHISTVKNAIRRLEGKGDIRIANQKGRPNSYELID